MVPTVRQASIHSKEYLGKSTIAVMKPIALIAPFRNSVGLGRGFAIRLSGYKFLSIQIKQ
jgi:hypothetical protein